jgi:hypothetical protein
MSEDLDSEIDCPTCGWSGRRRDLFAEYQHLTILKCRSCWAIVESSEAFGSIDRDVFFAGNIATLDVCVADIGEAAKCRVEEKPRDEDSGLWRWAFVGLSDPWECRIVYHKEQGDFVRLRLCAVEDVPALDADERRLKSLAAQHGAEFGSVAPMAIPGLLGQLPSANTADLWWGVHQTVGLNSLSPALFLAILPRLKAAMELIAPVVKAINAEAR